MKDDHRHRELLHAISGQKKCMEVIFWPLEFVEYVVHATAAIVRNSASEEDEMKMQRERNYQSRKKSQTVIGWNIARRMATI